MSLDNVRYQQRLDSWRLQPRSAHRRTPQFDRPTRRQGHPRIESAIGDRGRTSVDVTYERTAARGVVDEPPGRTNAYEVAWNDPPLPASNS